MLFFLLIPLLGCIYTGWHVWRILPFAAVWKWMVVVAMLMCFLQMFINYAIGLDRMPMSLARVLYAIGTSSLIILLYFFMLFVVMDLGRLFRLIPASFMHDSVAGSLTVAGIMLAVFIYGNVHYYNKVRVPINIETGKLASPIRLAMISDLHLGYHNTRRDLAKWVDMLNKENVDAILIAGDIVDIDVSPLIEENMAEEFKRLNAPVYACLGNHDYLAGEPNSEKFYQESGIQLLRDSYAVVDSQLVIIGRDDRTNRQRKSIAQLMNALAREQGKSATIILDHQPYHLEEAEQAGVDFQFSGHTHYGQVWPISWIEDMIYECAFGAHQRGNTRYYVSSGLGIWGGKFRIGTQSEYIIATVE